MGVEPGTGSSDRNVGQSRVVLSEASGLRRVTFEDETGRMWVAVLPGNAPDSAAPNYPRLGPPPVAEILFMNGWPRDMANRVQSELVFLGILTQTEARTPAGRAAVTAALRHALATDAQAIIDLYLAEG